MRAALAVLCTALSTLCWAEADDLFLGVFESETRQNFGSGTPGEWRIEVVAGAGKGQYVATLHHSGKVIATQELVPCSEDKEGYLRNRPPGRVEVLCADVPGAYLRAFLTYAENGIYVEALKRKYIENPSLAKQEGIPPGDPALFEIRHHKAKYYAHAQLGFYGFRKVAR